MHGDSPHILLGAKVQEGGGVPVQNLQPASHAQSVLFSGGLKSFLEQQKFGWYHICLLNSPVSSDIKGNERSEGEKCGREGKEMS